MYLKTAGSVLVIAASTWLGCLMGRELYERLDRLSTMKRIFLVIRQEILYSGMPLFEVFGNVSKRFEDPYKTWMLALEHRAKERNVEGQSLPVLGNTWMAEKRFGDFGRAWDGDGRDGQRRACKGA